MFDNFAVFFIVAESCTNLPFNSLSISSFFSDSCWSHPSFLWGKLWSWRPWPIINIQIKALPYKNLRTKENKELTNLFVGPVRFLLNYSKQYVITSGYQSVGGLRNKYSVLIIWNLRTSTISNIGIKVLPHNTLRTKKKLRIHKPYCWNSPFPSELWKTVRSPYSWICREVIFTIISNKQCEDL